MPRMNLRGLCVCSFGLRTIAVLMSLFPSLGISSFRTAVCCDGENEYTTPAPVCQPFLAFFLIFFADFFCPPRYAGRQCAASLFCVRGALASGFFLGVFYENWTVFTGYPWGQEVFWQRIRGFDRCCFAEWIAVMQLASALG